MGLRRRHDAAPGRSRRTATRPAAATSRRSPSPTTTARPARSWRRSSSTFRQRPPSTPAARAGRPSTGPWIPRTRPPSWSVEYGPTEEYGAVTSAQSLPGGLRPPPGERDAARAPGRPPLPLPARRRQRDGQQLGRGPRVRGGQRAELGRLPRRPARHRAAWSTTGASESSPGPRSSDETSATTGSFQGRYVLGQPGVLGPLRNTAASFDGVSGELAMPGSQLGANATLEGWFRWRAGTAVLRDSTSTGRQRLDPCLRRARAISSTASAARASTRACRSAGARRRMAPPGRHEERRRGRPVRRRRTPCIRRRPAPARSSPTAPWHVMRNGTNPGLLGGRGRRARPLHARAQRRRGQGPLRPGEGPRRRSAARAIRPPTSRRRRAPAAGGGVLGPSSPAAETPRPAGSGPRSRRGTAPRRPRRAGRAQQPDRAAGAAASWIVRDTLAAPARRRGLQAPQPRAP